MRTEKEKREQLIKHLEGGSAFKPMDEFLDEIPFKNLGKKPCNLPYSFYEIFFHICFAQKDILEYTISGDYQTRNWPEDYWPDQAQPRNEIEWENLKTEFFEDRSMLRNFILDLNNELDEPVPSSPEHSLFREIMLIIEHNAYHTGQLLLIQRLLGDYKP